MLYGLNKMMFIKISARIIYFMSAGDSRHLTFQKYVKNIITYLEETQVY